MREADFLQNVRDVAKLCGWLVYHTHDSRRSDPGFPDLVMVRGRTLIFAELKAEKGRVTPEQTVWLEALERVSLSSYVIAEVWRPSDWPRIEKLLTGPR